MVDLTKLFSITQTLQTELDEIKARVQQLEETNKGLSKRVADIGIGSIVIGGPQVRL